MLTMAMAMEKKGGPSWIPQSVILSIFVNFNIQIKCFSLLIEDSSRICKDHVAKRSQDDTQIQVQSL